jgi:cysteine-rich repeat protein
MLLRRHQSGPRVRSNNAFSVIALSVVTLYTCGLCACGRDRVVVQSDRTLTSAASQDSAIGDEGSSAGTCGDDIVGPGEECEPPGTASCDPECRRIAGRCGNGVLDPFEECEDGNAVGGDGCSADCLREACGNGRIDVGEDCEPPGTAQCTASCKLVPHAACGNGIQEPGEECEDGNQLSGDGCSADCLIEFCGNGRVDPGETCEPPDTDTCNVRCQSIPPSSRRGVCGNGVRESTEECDDGNTFDADGCSGSCELEVCGNGRLDPGEYCEPPNTAVCDSRCYPRLERCGDRLVGAGEECDDGNVVDGDGCSARCEIEACGNGRLDVGEECEPPKTEICSASCKRISRLCGNRIVEPPEECDDGNVIPGDGCDLRCQLEFCGNGRLDFGEECELPGTAVCDATCHHIGPWCGDGQVDVGEGCDPPNDSSCSSTCQVLAVSLPPPVVTTAPGCGNGVLDPGEECDDSNLFDADGCSAGCLKEVCGNARLDVGEECDDGNLVSGDGCSASCRAEVCGNGRIDFELECEPPGSPGCSAVCRTISAVCGNAQLEAGEGCDDGNLLDGDGCSASCSPEPVPPEANPSAAAQ